MSMYFCWSNLPLFECFDFFWLNSLSPCLSLLLITLPRPYKTAMQISFEKFEPELCLSCMTTFNLVFLLFVFFKHTCCVVYLLNSSLPKLGIWKFEWMFSFLHVSHVKCHMSHVMYNVAHVTRHMYFFYFGVVGQSVGVSWWRVCY